VKDCSAESQWSEKAEMNDGTLYLLNKHRLNTTPQLAALANSPQCIDAGWGLVCSRQYLMPPIANSTEQQMSVPFKDPATSRGGLFVYKDE
jgi:hypothetical protein